MRYLKKILIVVFVVCISLIVASCGRNGASSSFFKELTGTLNGEEYNFIYSTDNRKQNTVNLYEKDGKVCQRIYTNIGDRTIKNIVGKDNFADFCTKFGVESEKDLHNRYGQLVWTGENYLIFEDYTADGVLNVFDIKAGSVVVLSNGCFIIARETENQIQVFTTEGINTFSYPELKQTEYNFNNDLQLGEYDYAEADMVNYIAEEDFCIYAQHTYTFADDNTFEKTYTYLNFYSIHQDCWQVEKYEDIVCLDYFVQDDKVYFIYVEDEKSPQIIMAKYVIDDNGMYLEDTSTIELPDIIHHMQNGGITNYSDYMVYSQYAAGDEKFYFTVIDKSKNSVSFSAWAWAKDIDYIVTIK